MPPRMAHAAVIIHNTTLVVLGGRRGPVHALDDVWSCDLLEAVGRGSVMWVMRHAGGGQGVRGGLTGGGEKQEGEEEEKQQEKQQQCMPPRHRHVAVATQVGLPVMWSACYTYTLETCTLYTCTLYTCYTILHILLFAFVHHMYMCTRVHTMPIHTPIYTSLLTHTGW